MEKENKNKASRTVIKIIVAMFGAIEMMFTIFIPISIALLLVIVVDANPFYIIPFGIISSLYRAAKLLIDLII